jgi:hypothetical protein
MLVSTEAEDREVQMRGLRRRVAARADVAKRIAASDESAFAKVWRIAIEVSVVVREALFEVELIDRQASGSAV